NGFPNCYWGWGPEDLELGFRCRIKGYDFERRDGTYIPLRHKHAGFSAPHVWTEEGKRTNELFQKRKPHLRELIEQDGVGALKFELLEKKPLTLANGQPVPNGWHCLVDLGPPDIA
ncbi:MAG TPA: galactosyltransferase-related protein, partial [Pseudolabrys sp.]|nr:galactosyltransferase-related protein [Pseudolabrys sp.]